MAGGAQLTYLERTGNEDTADAELAGVWGWLAAYAVFLVTWGVTGTRKLGLLMWHPGGRGSMLGLEINFSTVKDRTGTRPWLLRGGLFGQQFLPCPKIHC